MLAWSAAALFTVACGKWSSSEQKEIDAFRTSVFKAQEASAGQSAGLTMSQAEITRATTALRESLNAANAVSDPILARLHPELPDQYRKRFVVAVRMRLEALDALREGTALTARDLEWQVPMAEWGDWYDRALPTLRQNIGG